MAIHLIRLCVGANSIEDLARWQDTQRTEWYGHDVAIGGTRRKPTRDKELTNGGSIYWVINRRIQVRQKLIGFEVLPDEEGRDYCRIYYDPVLVKTVAHPHRPFQGWRYLEPDRAPADRGVYVSGEMEDPPEEMAKELRVLGLID